MPQVVEEIKENGKEKKKMALLRNVTSQATSPFLVIHGHVFRDFL